MSHFNIEVETTSNPNIVKFVADSFLTKSTSYEFHNIEEAKPSPLAQELFYLPFVKTVYISQNFIAIEKYNIVEWSDVQEEVAASISEYLKSEKPIISETDAPNKTAITIYAESTPNPSVMKFIANKTLASEIYEFKNIDEAEHSPLAQALFNFPFIKEVFISDNYISVMKYNVADWQEISMEIREFIRKFIEDGKVVISESIDQENKNTSSRSSESSKSTSTKEFSDIENEIISILDEYVKPAVATDGGNIQFDSYNAETKTVKVVLQGACSGCPSSTVTLKNGIETMMREMLKGRVDYVEAVNG